MMTTTPVRRRVVVATTADRAFSLFTDEIGAWWPVDGPHSVFGAGSRVSFRDGRLVEVAPDGRESVWGSVLAWEPPHRLRITWHPGHDESVSTEVEVSFVEIEAGRTEVTLVHSGWERLPNPEVRGSYDAGWVFVLDQYGARVS